MKQSLLDCHGFEQVFQYKCQYHDCDFLAVGQWNSLDPQVHCLLRYPQSQELQENLRQKFLQVEDHHNQSDNAVNLPA